MKILTHRSCIVSARLLRDALQTLTDERIWLTTDAAKIRRGSFIRYGNAERVAVPDTTFNSAAFIRLVSDKARFSKVMAEGRVHSPVYNRAERPRNFPVLIRKTLTGMGGSGIVVCANQATFNRNWDQAYVWTPFIKTDFELRVHVLGGQVAKIFKKVYRPDVAQGAQLDNQDGHAEPQYPIRNLERGYHFSAREIAKYPKITELVRKVQPLLNGSFYTLDVGWDATKKEYFVFEANSGSGLNPHTVELYAQYLNDNL